MKLKKIASLALAGVMAVSMLAGCAGKTGTTTDEGTTVVTTGSSAAVSTFNADQDADNKVKVTFSADSKLDGLLASALKALGQDAEWATAAAPSIKDYIESTVGKYDTAFNLANTSNANLSDGMTKTQAYGLEYGSASRYWSEEDAIKAAARAMDATVAGLAENTKEGKGSTDTYYEYSYTGTVAVAETVKADGTTVYHVVYTITQTATKATV